MSRPPSEFGTLKLFMEMFSIVGPTAMTAKEAEHVPQSAWGQENRRPLLRRWAPFRLGHGQICPMPTNGGHPAGAQAYQHPRRLLSPEHPPYAPRLSAVGAVFRNDRHRTSAE